MMPPRWMTVAATIFAAIAAAIAGAMAALEGRERE